MGKFDSLSKTNQSKRKYQCNYNNFYKKNRHETSVDYDYFESLYVQELWNLNQKKKYNKDLITLWAKLDMKSYIDYELGNTVNLYLTNSNQRISVNQLEDYNYLSEDERRLNLLDIKYIKSIKLENTIFKNLYLAIYDISDADKKFRPYVLLYTKNEHEQFIEIGYGYDSNNNGDVELFISSFNYPVFLTKKGYIFFPITRKKVKLDIYDYITDEDIIKLY